MRTYLTKKNRKTTEFVFLETEGNLLRKMWGRVGRSGAGNSTQNPGTAERAIEVLHEEAQSYREQGFEDAPIPDDFKSERTVVFDKAKWHLNDEFPRGLAPYQAYVHTGMFVCWLVTRGLVEQEVLRENERGLVLINTRSIGPARFYHDCLDGIFDSEGLEPDAIAFVSQYFDFENGQYLNDYLATLDPKDDLPSVFHVEDAWENFDALAATLDRRYEAWKVAAI